MGRREYQIARDKAARTPNGASVAGDVDLTDRRPRCASLVNDLPVVIADYARLQFPRGRATEG
jgi:hypothetical protein